MESGYSNEAVATYCVEHAVRPAVRDSIKIAVLVVRLYGATSLKAAAFATPVTVASTVTVCGVDGVV